MINLPLDIWNYIAWLGGEDVRKRLRCTSKFLNNGLYRIPRAPKPNKPSKIESDIDFHICEVCGKRYKVLKEYDIKMPFLPLYGLKPGFGCAGCINRYMIKYIKSKLYTDTIKLVNECPDAENEDIYALESFAQFNIEIRFMFLWLKDDIIE